MGRAGAEAVPDVVQVVYQGAACSLGEVEAELDDLLREAPSDLRVLPGVAPEQLSSVGSHALGSETRRE
jgi:hypothetical protein